MLVIVCVCICELDVHARLATLQIGVKRAVSSEVPTWKFPKSRGQHTDPQTVGPL